MKHIFNFAVIIATIAFTLFGILASCKNNMLTKKTVNIIIEADKNINVSCAEIDVKIGSRWKNIKRRVLSCVQCKKGYKLDKLMLKDGNEPVAIENNFAFEEDASIYITSIQTNKNRKERDGASEDEEPEEVDEKICIEIKGDRHTNIEDNELLIEKDSTWGNIKEEIVGRLEFEKGYCLNKCKLSSSRGRILNDEYMFKKDVAIYVISKKEKKQQQPEESVMISLKGDKNVILEYIAVEVPKCTRWEEVKETEYIKSATAKQGYHLSAWHLKKDVNAPHIQDEYQFCKKTNIFIFAIADKENPDNSDVPDEPDSPDNPDVPNAPNPEESVIIYLEGDKNVVLEYVAVEVPKYTYWKDIKETEYIQSARAKRGYHLSAWHLKKDMNASQIQDEYQFCKKTTIFISAVKNDEMPEDSNTPSVPDEPDIPEEQLPSQTDVKAGDDETMIDVAPSSDGIKSSSIDYPLPNFPTYYDKQLWQGVFPNNETIYITPFKMAKYELTYRIWKETRMWAIENGYTFLNEGGKGSRNNDEMSEMQPVTMISWCDAIVWCNAHTEKLNSKTDACVYLNVQNNIPLKNAKDVASMTVTNIKIDLNKKGFRLPTEEEWEYAARREAKSSNNVDDAGGDAWFTKLDSVSGAKCSIASGNTVRGNFSFMKKELEATTVCQKYFTGKKYEYFVPNVFSTRCVGTKRPNYLGFHDMSGNVLEFSCNLTEEAGFQRDKSEGVFCVVRGGAWDDFSYDCTVGRRKCVNIKHAKDSLGLRLCCSK